MIQHTDITDKNLLARIKSQDITFAGNMLMKIYGTLKCQTGKRLKRFNRIFFHDEQEAHSNGYRPCGHCMNKKYKIWKSLEKK